MAYRTARASAMAAAAAAVTLAAFILVAAEGVDGPRAAPFVALWTFASVAALAGVELRARGRPFGAVLVGLGLLGVVSSYVSMGGGFVYALLCGPLLLITLIATLAMRRAEMG